jgi:hypothetical protein
MNGRTNENAYLKAVMPSRLLARGHVVTWQRGFINDTAESGSAVSTAYQSRTLPVHRE